MNQKNEKDIERFRQRFAHVYELATAGQRAEGRLWYREAHEFACEVSRETGLSLPQVCGVISALSPAVYWELNKRQAEALCVAYANGGDLADVALSTYGKQTAKAKAILDLSLETPNICNEICAILGVRAFKTIAFFDAIWAPSLSASVAIDRHMVDASGIGDLWTRSAEWCYELLADAVRQLARDLGRSASEVQATIWIVWKALTNGYSPEESAGLPDKPDDDIPI